VQEFLRIFRQPEENARYRRLCEKPGLLPLVLFFHAMLGNSIFLKPRFSVSCEILGQQRDGGKLTWLSVAMLCTLLALFLVLLS